MTTTTTKFPPIGKFNQGFRITSIGEPRTGSFFAIEQTRKRMGTQFCRWSQVFTFVHIRQDGKTVFESNARDMASAKRIVAKWIAANA